LPFIIEMVLLCYDETLCLIFLVIVLLFGGRRVHLGLKLECIANINEREMSAQCY